MKIRPAIHVFQLERGVTNMPRVRSSVFYLLLCLSGFLYEVSGFTYNSIEVLKEHIVDAEIFISDTVDWKCNSGLDCTVARSSCINGTCQCHAGYIYSGNMTSCIKVATAYGDECEESIQCSRYLFNGGTCTNATCVCAEGYYYIHGRCNAYSGLFGKCHKDDDCYVNGDLEATSCVNGACKCSSGYYQREYRACRPKAKDVGAKCMIHNDCMFNNAAYCSANRTCALSEITNSISKFVYDDGILQRNYAVKIEIDKSNNCTVDEDCDQLGAAFCGHFGTCVCKRAYFFEKKLGKCVPEIGEPCLANDNAAIKYSECKNGKWSCQLERVVSKNNRECEKAIRRYKDYCRTDRQCYIFGPDAICQDNKCICNENSRFNETELFCWIKRGIGEVCQQDVDCYANDPNTKLFCTDSVCTCPNGTHSNSNRTACIETSAGIGKPCEVDDDCITKNSACMNETCVCRDNYYELNNQCVPGINSSCTSNNDCTPENSECTSGYCTCKENYVLTSVSSCKPVALVGESCQEDIQCSSKQPHAVCLASSFSTTNSTSNYICICSDGYHYKHGRCFERKVLGMSCKNLGECYLDSNDDAVVCKNGRCACDWGYIRINDTVCGVSQHYDINGSSITSISTSLLSSVLLLFARFLMQSDC